MTASATADPTSADSSHPVAPEPASPAVPAPTSSGSPTTSAAPSPDAGQLTPAGVRTGRSQIDDLDARILALITERISTAADIQTARIADGGRRLDLKRETEIIARYRGALGRPGVTVAMAVLELCRGRV